MLGCTFLGRSGRFVAKGTGFFEVCRDCAELLRRYGRIQRGSQAFILQKDPYLWRRKKP